MRHDMACRAAAVAALTGLTLTLAPAAPARADTVREMQWHLRALRMDRVHAITKGAGVVVGVIDTGVEATHPDLRGQVLPGVGLGKGAGPAGAAVDSDGHGTGIAGTIAAKGGGAMRALGIAPAAKILPVRVVDKGYATTAAIDDGIRWATDHGARVINLSVAASTAAPDSTREAVAYALGKDVVVVAGAGNRPEGHTIVGTPANIPGVIAVGATSESGGLWSGSVTGPEMVITAPGVEVVAPGSRAAGIRSGYVAGTGTSSATAVVSGAAALIRARFPRLKAPDVINRLITTADDAGPAGRDDQYGYGRLDILRALTARVPSVSANPLGAPQASASARPGDLAAGDDARPNPLTGEAIAGLVLMATVLLVVPVALIILLVMSRRRRRRQPALAGAPGGWYPPAGPPPRQPGGQWPAPPGGYPPAAPRPYPPAQPGQYPPAPPGGYPPNPPGPYPPAPRG